MKVRLDYGRTGLEVELPEKNVVGVLKGQYAPPLEHPTASVWDAIRRPIGSSPLAELAMGKKSACIVVSDITRPVPNAVILPPMLQTLEESGISRENITILIATGMHRPNLGDEMIQVLGMDIPKRYRVVNHYCERDDEQVLVGHTSRGFAAYVDKTYVDADLKILTGLIEPHFMAGYSGGRKAMCPGIVSLKTAETFHSPALLEHPKAANGVLDGNPLHEMALEICKMAGVDFILNVVISDEKQITGVFAGELEAAHLSGVKSVEDQTCVEVPSKADVVITTGGGYPLDTTLYQAVKGMVGALPVVKPGGVVLIVSALEEGFGSPEFEGLLCEMSDHRSFIEMIEQPGFFIKDQWEVEMLCKVLNHAEVWLVSDNSTQFNGQKPPITPVESIEAGVGMALKRFGENTSILVIPSGPYISVQSPES